LGTGHFIHHRIASAVKRVENVSGRMSYIDLRGHRFDVVVLNGHAPSEEKSDDSKDSSYEKLGQVFEHYPQCHMKILLGDFNAKVGRENFFKPTIGNKILHQDSKENGVRIINIATSENLVVKSTMCPHRNLLKYSWPSPDGKTHDQIDHIPINRRWHSSIFHV
jgi:hypothetical protein